MNTKIQDSFAGYKFDDVIRMDEEEKRLREKIKGRRKILRKKEETIDDAIKDTSETKTRRGSVSYRVQEFDGCYDILEAGTTEIRKYRFLKKPLERVNDQGTTHALTYYEWGALGIENIARETQGFVPASTKDVHIFARAAYENRNIIGYEEVAEHMREFLSQMIDGTSIGTYSRIRWDGKSACIMHSEGLPQEHWCRLPDIVREQPLINLKNEKQENKLAEAIFGDTATNTKKIYEWILETRYQKQIVGPLIGYIGNLETPQSIGEKQTVPRYRVTEQYYGTTTKTHPTFTINLLGTRTQEDRYPVLGVMRL